MAKFNKSQLLMLSLLAAILFLTPVVPSSLRPKYLYFVINLLIIALGVEAGLISVFSKPLEDKKILAVPVKAKPAMITTAREPSMLDQEKILNVAKVEKVKKCPSMPSLISIGSGEPEVEDVAEEVEVVEEEETGGLSGQELFTKAEMFIGNFYKQLKMQREESWNRIDGF